MIDGGEHAEQSQRSREHHEIRRQAGGDQRHPAAGIEQREHIAPAPAIGQPSRRQRKYAEGNERGGAQRDQFGIAAGVGDLERDHYHRKNQHDVVIERMGKIDEADGHASRGLLCVCWYRGW